jgi:hypothetical protein
MSRDSPHVIFSGDVVLSKMQLAIIRKTIRAANWLPMVMPSDVIFTDAMLANMWSPELKNTGKKKATAINDVYCLTLAQRKVKDVREAAAASSKQAASAKLNQKSSKMRTSMDRTKTAKIFASGFAR